MANKSKQFPLRSVNKRVYAGKVEVVDRETGELLDTRIKYRTQAIKTIFVTMYLNDENLYEFISGLGNQGRVIAYILKDYNDKTGMFYFSGTSKELMVKELGLSIGTIRSAVRELASKRTIIHVGGAEYMVNPRLFYKGLQTNYENMVEVFDGLMAIVDVRDTQKSIDKKTVEI